MSSSALRACRSEQRQMQRAVLRVLRTLGLPFTRLTREGRTLATTACAAAAFGVDIGRSETHVLLVATLSLLLASLLMTRRRALTGVLAEARTARRVAVGEELTVRISLRNESAIQHERLRFDVASRARSASWTVMPPTLPTLAPRSSAELLAKARFATRGERRIGPFGLSSLSPLGLAHGASLRLDARSVLVVPRPARVTSIEGARSAALAQGDRTRAWAGDARELLGVRPYRPGDAVRDLHARSWARAGFPVVREYQVEEQERVALLIDCGGDAKHARLEAALSLAAGVAGLLARTGGGLGPIFIGGERIKSPAGARDIDAILDALAIAKADQGLGVDMLTKLGALLRQMPSLVIVAPSWSEARKALRDALIARGITTTVLVVADEAKSSVEGVAYVPIAAITAGEELRL